MTVKVRQYRKRKDAYEVDIRFEWPGGGTYRERRKAPGTSRTGAQRWGEQRERDLLLRGREAVETPVEPEQVKRPPTFAEWKQTYLDDHCKANRQKPATLVLKESILRVHVLPLLGDTRLDEVTTADVQRLKGRLAGLAPKTVNNVLTTLSAMLKAAIKGGILDEMPCDVDLLRAHYGERPFYDFADYERLVEAAELTDERALLVVLLAGEAGMRMGEIIALRWNNVLFDRRVVRVVESEWRGNVTAPKSGRSREVPMTDRLHDVLRATRHLRGSRVLVGEKGKPITSRMIQRWMERVERRAGLDPRGRVHIFRHSFCSHLAIKGAPARAVQELAGHAELTTTMAYMHLSPAARVSAIQLLNSRPADAKAAVDAAKTAEPVAFGEMLEKGRGKKQTP